MTFTATGTISVAAIGGVGVEYLVVAGGGGGGGWGGAGGGAGGYLTGNQSLTAGTSYTVTVGAGGVGITAALTTPDNTSGSNSVFSAVPQ